MKIPHIRVYNNYGFDYHTIKITGKWKYVTNHYRKNVMYIEIYWGFFNLLTRWIHEDSIEFLEETKEEIFNCKDKNK